jgi:hypothetical protein
MRQVAIVTGDVMCGCHGYDGACEKMSSVSFELRLLNRFYHIQCIFYVRCGLRLKKQLGIALFCLTMLHVLVISYQSFRITDWSYLDFWILD